MRINRLLSFFIAALLVLFTLSPLPAIASPNGRCNCGRTPVIILPGYSGSHLFLNPGEEGELQLWPPVVDGSSVRSVAEILASTLPRLIADAGGNADAVVEQFGELFAMFDLLAMNPDGTPVHNTDTMVGGARNFRWDVLQERGQERYNNQRPITNSLNAPHDYIYCFFNDWRLGQVDAAERLHAFIQSVKEDSGHDKVNLFGISYGGQMAAAYFHLYGSGDVERAVLHAPAIQGSTLAVDLFENEDFAFDPARLLEVLMIYMGRENLFNQYFQRISIDQLNDVALRIIRTYLEPMAVNIGSFWDVVPPEHYDRLKEKLLDPVEHVEIIRKSDFVHYEVMPQAGETLRRMQAEGMKIAVIAGHGLPLVSGRLINSDYIIDTVSTTGASLHGEFSQHVCTDPMHPHLSPDGTTCARSAYLPEHTWFFRGQYHGQGAADVYARELYNLWLFTDEIQDIYSDPRFPQFRESSNAADGLGARFSGSVSGYLAAHDETLLVRNLSDFEISLLSVTAEGHDFSVALANRIILRPGDTKRLRYETLLPKERQVFTLRLEFIREAPIPVRETRELVFTAIPAYDDIPEALRFPGDDPAPVPLRLYPVQALLVSLALSASLFLASFAVGVIYRKRLKEK